MEIEDLLPLPEATFHILMAVAEDDRHGYAIIQDVATRTHGTLKLSPGTLYRSIQRMFELPDATRVFVCHDYGPGGRAMACETTIGEQKRANIHVRDGISEAEFVAMREARDATLAMPALLLPSVQVNIRAGALPEPEDNGVRYLKLPLDSL